MLRWFVVPLVLLGACAPAAPRSTPAPEAPAAPVAATTEPEARRPQIIPPPDFRQAIAAGTRTETGEPGPAYWQNEADYTMSLRVEPEQPRVEGSVTIRYTNNSPHSLPGLVLDLTQNFHAPGGMRLEPVEITGGVDLGRVAVDGTEIAEAAAATGMAAYQVQGTKLLIRPNGPVAAGATVEIAVDWSFIVPEQGAGGRMGHSRGNVVHLAYFYPRIAVFDDVAGWSMDQFLGTAEFYHGFGDYDVTVEAPAGWLVTGTGELTNRAEVLAPAVLERLELAERSDTVVRIVGFEDAARATRATSGTQQWRFRADRIRDVAYSLTRESAWDAARTPVGDRDGDGMTDHARVDALYRSSAPLWSEVARYSQHVIEYLSGYTGIPYPWPHMTAVEGAGIIGGGMEFPMITLMGDYNAAGPDALYNVTAHELAHMWVPMIVSTNERRYAWMDEGTTNFNENQSRENFTPEATPELADRASYLNVARAEAEGEITRRSDYHYTSNAYAVATYFKPSALLTTLRGLLGEEAFMRAYRTFLERWSYRHPYPWDLWNTFEDVTGEDLSWFWHHWYHETAVLDQAVESVVAGENGTEIVIRAIGEAPMPSRLSITLADGGTLQREIPVEEWLTGARTRSVRVEGEVVRVEIDSENAFPDVDRDNNVWTR